jgi:predicted alpha/beta hydrolase family esterase
MTKQICIIHGGETFSSDEEYLKNLKDKELKYERILYSPSWSKWIAVQLTDHDVLLPSMPNKQNARYDEWSIYFSKIMPFLQPSAILIGHSLGGIFLAKYLSENPPAKPFAKLILVAAPYSDETRESLGDFKLTSAKPLTNAVKEIHLMHSEDDPVVAVSELKRYAADLPNALVHRFTDKHHFIEPFFRELLTLI